MPDKKAECWAPPLPACRRVKVMLEILRGIRQIKCCPPLEALFAAKVAGEPQGSHGILTWFPHSCD